jgi:hypothetical protein
MGEKSLEITNFSGKKIPQVAKSHYKKKHCLLAPPRHHDGKSQASFLKH